jgi:hypothetical protein
MATTCNCIPCAGEHEVRCNLYESPLTQIEIRALRTQEAVVTQEPERTREYTVEVVDVGYAVGGFPPYLVRVDPGSDPEVFTDYAAAAKLATRLESQYRAVGANDMAALIRILTRTVVVHRGKWGQVHQDNCACGDIRVHGVRVS